QLCSDGIDNDGDGLADCQDWKCLDKKPCCTLPKLLHDEAFDAPACAAATCTAAQCPGLDAAVWQPWGVPEPTVCEGALRPYKARQCYEVGALLRMGVGMHPGLGVGVDIIGEPEPAGRLSVGLTLQDTVVGGSFVCEPLEAVTSFAEAQLLRAAGGS